MKALDREFGRDLARCPGSFALDIGRRHQRQPHAVRIAEGQDRFTEPLLRSLVADTLFDKAVPPVAKRPFRHPKHRFLRFADTEPARSGMLPREEGQDRTGMPRLIAVIQVISAWIVEVDRLLDQTQPKSAGVEFQILRWVEPEMAVT